MRPTISPPAFALAIVIASACDLGGEHVDRCFDLGDADVLRSARTDREVQGSSLQGSTMQGSTMQGTQYQGQDWQGTDYQGTKFGITALAGMRLEIADGSRAVTIAEGTLVSGTRVGASALRGVELVGIAPDDSRFPLRITAVDLVDGSERISILAGGTPVCADGMQGMFVPGGWDDTGAHSLVADELTYACMDGVIAKCVGWGYAPWQVGAELHQSCTRLARADYCGDGQPWTMNGTMIDVYDALGVQNPVHDPELSFEAAWGENGAICVNETRYDITGADGETVLPDCFATLPRCASLAEATELGAVIANDSAHAPIDACG